MSLPYAPLDASSHIDPKTWHAQKRHCEYVTINGEDGTHTFWVVSVETAT